MLDLIPRHTSSDIFVLKIFLVFVFIQFGNQENSFYLVLVLLIILVLVSVLYYKSFSFSFAFSFSFLYQSVQPYLLFHIMCNRAINRKSEHTIIILYVNVSIENFPNI